MEEWINQLYKSKGDFGKKTVDSRRSVAARNRKQSRNSMLMQFRNIPRTMSPFHTPVPGHSEPQPKVEKKSKRLEMLEKWKQEKEKKKLEAKKQQKPIFKVCHVQPKNDLDQVFSHIKGIKIKTKGQTPLKTPANPVIRKDEPKPSTSRQLIRNDDIKPINSRNNTAINLKGKTRKQSVNDHVPIPSVSKKPENSTKLNKSISKVSSTSKITDKKLSKIQSAEKFKLSTSSQLKKNVQPLNSRNTSSSVSRVRSKTDLKTNSSKEFTKNNSVKYSKNDNTSNAGEQTETQERENVNWALSEQNVPDSDEKTPEKQLSPTRSAKRKSLKKSKVGSIDDVSDYTAGRDSGYRSTNTPSIKVRNASDDSEYESNACYIPTLQTRCRSSRKSISRTPKQSQLLNDSCLNEITSNSTSSKKRMSTRRQNNLDRSSTDIDGTSNTSRKSIIETPKADWKLVLNDTYEENITPNKVSTRGKKSTSGGLFIISKVSDNSSTDNDEENVSSKDKSILGSPITGHHLAIDEICQEDVTPRKVLRKKKRSTTGSLNVQGTSDRSFKENGEPFSSKPIIESPKAKDEGSLFLNDANQEIKTPNNISVKKKRSCSRGSLKIQNTSIGVPKTSRKSLNKTPKHGSVDSEVFVTPDKIMPDEDLSGVFFTPNRMQSIEQDEPIVYVSPFVTTSRGKNSARKEYHQRKSLEAINSSMSNSTDPKSPKTAAAYFSRILDNEINRIQDMCNIWQNYKDSENLSEDACGLIDMTIGQSNLLISKKFNQFRVLIEKCRNNDDYLGKKIQCVDLHGFWDMMYKQVTDLDKRFENLDDMKKNNWLEKVPEKAPSKRARKGRKRGQTKSASSASSLLKETILAARKQKAAKQHSSENDLELLISKKNSTPNGSRLADKSLLNVQVEGSTPGRGILKSSNIKSEKRKTVIFKDVRLSMGDGKENKLTPISARKGTPLPTRRSERISVGRSKLTFD